MSETRRLQRGGNFRTRHERLPDESASGVLRHENHRANVYPQYVGIIPSRGRIECINKPIFYICFISPLRFHVFQRIKTDSRLKSDASAGGGWNNAAVDVALLRRTAPGGVA